MNSHKHIISEHRLIYFEGSEKPPSSVHEEAVGPKTSPDESTSFDPEKRKEAREQRKAEETDDVKKEENELQTIENQLDGIDAQELQRAEAFMNRARETLKTEGQKEVYDEGIKALSPQEKIAIYKDTVITDESMGKFTSFDHSAIDESSLIFFADSVIFSSLKPIDLGKLPKILEGTAESIHAEWASRIGDETLTLLRQANAKIKESVGNFLKKKGNEALLQQVTQKRDKKERDMKKAMAVLKLTDGFFMGENMGAYLKSNSELQTQVRLDVDEMVKKLDGQHGVKIENKTDKKDDKMSLNITPKNDAQYKKILEIAKKQLGSNVHEAKAFMKKPSIEIKKINPNEMKVFVAKLRDAKLNKAD